MVQPAAGPGKGCRLGAEDPRGSRPRPGSAADAQLWYKASQFWSASSRTKHPEETAKFIDFLANNVKAGEALLADRGVYPNSDVREQRSSPS